MTIENYWRQNRQTNQQAMLSSFGSINKVWYLFPQGTGPANNAPSMNCFTTFAALAPNLRSRDLILLSGVLREQATAPLGVYDVTIVGAANTPRQATSSGTPLGAGATWLAPTSPTASTPLLTLREQGWSIYNIMFGTVASTPSIRLKRQETAANPDASHALISGCYFATQGLSSEIGIGSESLFHSIIQNCLFSGLNNAILGESVSIAQPQRNMILGNRFISCVNAIDWPMDDGLIDGNTFYNITTKRIDVNVGARNRVGINFVDATQANISIAGGFIGNATDYWRNYSTDTAALTVGTPA